MKKKYMGTLLGVIATILLAVWLFPKKTVADKGIHIDVDQKFYQYDMNGDLMGTIPVKFQGVIHENSGEKGFDGVVEVVGYELQYVDEPASDEQSANVFVHHDEETGYVHLIINGFKSVTEYNITQYLHSEYQYNITFLKEDPGTIVVRVGQMEEKTNEYGGESISWPTIFYVVLAESKEAATAWVADELEQRAQYSQQKDGTELPPAETTTPAPEFSQETSPVQEGLEHLQALGDVDGDGTEETLILRDFDDPGTKAFLWVNEENVLELQGQGELSEHSCRLVAADMDEDGMAEVKNATLRAEWFDETGVPVVGPIQVTAMTSNAEHVVEDGQICFQVEVMARDTGEHGGQWDEIWGIPIITVSYENGQLVTADAIGQTVLKVLTDAGE